MTNLKYFREISNRKDNYDGVYRIWVDETKGVESEIEHLKTQALSWQKLTFFILSNEKNVQSTTQITFTSISPQDFTIGENTSRNGHCV